ncbi:hypothetical protein evm_009089 [Chilo suppressalis]|nr:hypothetical protein evm_009089 [Chilo suppressalis]
MIIPLEKEKRPLFHISSFIEVKLHFPNCCDLSILIRYIIMFCEATVEQGALQGKILEAYDGRKYYSFEGIPYAKPPVGDLRFKIKNTLMNKGYYKVNDYLNDCNAWT